jgi:hypothetical protein
MIPTCIGCAAKSTRPVYPTVGYQPRGAKLNRIGYASCDVGAGGVVAAVCHGPIALAHVTLSDGTRLIAGKNVTGDRTLAVTLLAHAMRRQRAQRSADAECAVATAHCSPAPRCALA